MASRQESKHSLGTQAFANLSGAVYFGPDGATPWLRLGSRRTSYKVALLQATEGVLTEIIKACRHYGRVPTSAEMRLYRTKHSSFPSHGAISNHFPRRSELLKALEEHASNLEADNDIALMIPKTPQPAEAPCLRSNRKSEGSVYLLKSGGYYKIGRSDEVERRVKEIRISLPETVSLVHTITTDDPAGIEAYWHRRFADRRANGEWFKLDASDLAAFKRRRYQ